MAGFVSGSGINWTFFGHRPSRPVQQFSGGWKVGNALLIIRQTGASAMIFWDFQRLHIYGTATISGNFLLADFRAVDGRSGRFYLYRSVDGQKAFMRWFILDAPVGRGNLTFDKGENRPLPAPPAGWIGIDGAQRCLIRGQFSGRLSCMLADDAEESHYCMDPRTLPLIDYWPTTAKPFANWSQARYDCWGRWIGTAPNNGGVAQHNCHRPETNGRTRCEFLIEHLGTTPSHAGLPRLQDFICRKLLE